MNSKHKPELSLTAKSLGCFLLSCCIINAAQAKKASDIRNLNEGVLVETEVVWKTPSSAPQLFSNHQHTPLWHYNNSTYFVWVDSALRAWVTQVKDGKAQSVPLDNNPDYKVLNDSHNRFSMGIDKKGYIHITGDMHNYTKGTTSSNYPARYQKQAILYWKSAQPENVGGGFEFVGAPNSPTALPATGFSYGRFFTDNNKELYYSSRVKAIEQSHTSGEMGFGVYRYNADTQTWTALGGKAEDTRRGTYYNVLLWENAGMAPEKWYQGFMNNLKFDSSNRLHMAATINSDNTLSGNDRLVYAFSNDQGLTWYKLNGQKIDPLPIRAKDGLTNQADIVNKTQAAPFFDSKVKVLADRNGRPAVLNGPVYVWNGSSWGNQSDKFFLANTVDLDNQGNVVLTATSSARMMRARSFDSPAYGYDFKGYNLYECLDEYSLRTTGVAYGVGINTKENTQSILKTTVTPAPLPEGWHGKDIAGTAPRYAGTSGFKNGKFIVNDYDVSIDNPSDSFYYVYKTMHGNGAITARVTIDGFSTNSRAGLMMRESLAYNSRDVFSIFVPNRKNAIFGFRTATGNHTANVWTPGYEETTLWVRLVREGDVFTGFVSKDGINWAQTGRTTLKLPSTLYVGMASASYHSAGMQTTTFEQVTAPVGIKAHITDK